MERKVMITGNWKMHKTIDEAVEFVKELSPHLANYRGDVYLAVPFTVIHPLTQECTNFPIVIGAQNMNDANSGAFTGEIAAKMLMDAGAKFVLLGHSERRHLYHEDNNFINRKIKRAVLDGIQPVLCIGETKKNYDEKETYSVLQTQLKECLQDLQVQELKNLVIAYEPVWAIGTGYSATAEMAETVHKFIREQIKEMFGLEFAEQIVIQYGGSVNPSNAKELLDQPNIDGLLIGGASLLLETFYQIVNDSQLNQISKGSAI